MYRKVHQRLTFTFTAVAGLILVIMSVVYLMMSEQNLKRNSYLSFQGEMNTILSNLEQQNTITNEWLAKISSNGKYLLALYDNGTALSYTRNALSATERKTLEQVQDYASRKNSASPAESYTTLHTEFTYDGEQGSYYACTARLPRKNGALSAVILYSTAPLAHQFFLQRIHFILLDFSALLVLFLFSWYYTRRLLSPIQEAQQKQNNFIAAASHELRTPLAVILSSVSAIHSSPASQQETFLRTIDSESQRMAALVNDMLTLARADNHSWSFSFQETELDTLLLNSYEAFYPLAKNKDLSLQITLPEEVLPLCYCDADRITQVIAVLLSNAISYSDPMNAIHLSLDFSQELFQITVTDHGIGISPEAKKHIFDRFYREDSSRSKKEHFGLGLSIAKEIINAHHGKITVSDTPGGGTTFCLILCRNYQESDAERHFLCKR